MWAIHKDDPALDHPVRRLCGRGDAAGAARAYEIRPGSASRRRSREALDRAHSQHRAGGPNRPPCCDVLSRPVPQPTNYNDSQDKEAVMSAKAMAIEGRAVLVTGANRGLGQALVEEALRRGATRVYAGSRPPLVHPDERVTPLTLDVTDPTQVQRAADKVGPLDILFNNAGVAVPDELSDRAALERHLAVNPFGTWDVTEAFLPQLTRTDGAVVNVVSVAALAAVPVLPAFSISKAAGFSLSQSLRALLAGRGVSVHAAWPARSTPTWSEISTSRRPRPRRSPGASSTGWREGRGDLPRPDVRDDGGELAHWSGQGARAPERRARRRDRRGVSTGDAAM
jgi:NAD(P)-dependent dehydrogenase (short-subunit alcohol dehydrogenase family)